MAINKNVWRFQCDPGGNPDPVVQVFLQSSTVVDGRTFTEQRLTPVNMKLSQMVAAGTMPGIEQLAIQLEEAALATAAKAAAELAELTRPVPPPVAGQPRVPIL
jgi:hypothetical protein